MADALTREGIKYMIARLLEKMQMKRQKKVKQQR